jgi:hypothetical protein
MGERVDFGDRERAMLYRTAAERGPDPPSFLPRLSLAENITLTEEHTNLYCYSAV